jgi:hypothetical protein
VPNEDKMRKTNAALNHLVAVDKLGRCLLSTQNNQANANDINMDNVEQTIETRLYPLAIKETSMPTEVSKFKVSSVWYFDSDMRVLFCCK